MIDLSPEAVAARQAEAAAGRGHGGLTARQLIARAGRNLDAAHRQMRAADKKGRWTAKGRAHVARAHDALVTAAVQLEIAKPTPLDTGHLHALTVKQLTAARAHVSRRVPSNDDEEAWALFAAYTSGIAAHQRTRSTQEGRT